MEEILNSLSACVLIVDKDQTVSFANTAMLEKCNLGPEDVIGKRCADIASCCPELHGPDLCPYEAVFGEGRAVNRRFERHTSEGWRKVFNLKASPMFNGDGRVSRMMTLIEDVTEKEEVENLLERSAEGLTILYELSNVFLTSVGIKKTLETALELVSEFYKADCTVIFAPSSEGEHLEFIAGTGWEDNDGETLGIVPEKNSLAGYALLERCPAIVTDFEGDDRFTMPPIFRKYGVQSGISVPMVAGDRIFGVLCILYKGQKMTDTSELWYLNVIANSLAVYLEKERSLERLEESESYLNSVLEGIGEGVVVIDRDMKIISANKSYLEGVKMAAEEVRGRYCYEISHNSSKPCYENGEDCTVKEVFETGQHHSALHTHHTSDRRLIHVLTNGYPIRDVSGNIVAAVETVADVTERVNLERDLEKRVKELEEFYDMAVGRELRMIELKEEIAELREELSKHKSS